MAKALSGLAPERAFVVHGSDGLDEVTTTGPTTVFEVVQEQVRNFLWTPADFGVDTASASDLTGGDRTTNRKIAIAVLQGERGPRRDIVVVNAAAAILAADSTTDTRDAVRRAAESIDTGSAWGKVQKLADFCSEIQRRSST